MLCVLKLARGLGRLTRCRGRCALWVGLWATGAVLESAYLQLLWFGVHGLSQGRHGLMPLHQLGARLPPCGLSGGVFGVRLVVWVEEAARHERLAAHDLGWRSLRSRGLLRHGG